MPLQEYTSTSGRQRRMKNMIKGFAEAVKKIKYVIEYGFHCNDLNVGEM